MARSTVHSVFPFLLSPPVPICVSEFSSVLFIFSLFFFHNSCFFSTSLSLSLFPHLSLPAATQGHEDSSIEWSARLCAKPEWNIQAHKRGILQENCKSVFEFFDSSPWFCKKWKNISNRLIKTYRYKWWSLSSVLSSTSTKVSAHGKDEHVQLVLKYPVPTNR